jgi:hypothetical protein
VNALVNELIQLQECVQLPTFWVLDD